MPDPEVVEGRLPRSYAEIFKLALDQRGRVIPRRNRILSEQE